VECDPKGVAPQVARCSAANVRRYPTWVIGGQRYEGVMPLDELAKASAFTGPTGPSSRR